MTACHDCDGVAELGLVRCRRCARRHARKAKARYWRQKLARIRAKVGRV